MVRGRELQPGNSFSSTSAVSNLQVIKTPRAVRRWPPHAIDDYLKKEGLRESSRKVYGRIAWNIDESQKDPITWALDQFDEQHARRTLSVIRSGVAYYLVWKGEAGSHKEASALLPRSRIGRQGIARMGLDPRDQVPELRGFLEGGAAEEPFRTLLILLLLTGLRISEACSLRQEDVTDARGGVDVLVAKGKGGKARVVPAGKELRLALDQYMSEVNPPGPYLFYGKRGRVLRPDQVRKYLQEECQTNEVLATLTPHVLRHTRASALLRKNVALPYIQAVLGHANLQTLDVYLHPDANEVARAVRGSDNES